MSSDSAAKRLRGARVLGLGFLALFLLLCITALVGYFGWEGNPAYWEDQQNRIAALSTEQREQVSESLFNRMMDQWSDGPKNATKPEDLIGHRSTIEIPYEELNIWIAQEGIDLLGGVGIELPKSVKGAMVDSAGNGLLRISCDLDNGKIQQVVAMTFEIQIKDDGTVISTLKRTTAGRLPVPAQTAIDMIAKRDTGGMMLDLMQGTPIGPIDLPIDPSKDGLRDGRLVGLEVGDEALVVTRETVRRKPAED